MPRSKVCAPMVCTIDWMALIISKASSRPRSWQISSQKLSLVDWESHPRRSRCLRGTTSFEAFVPQAPSTIRTFPIKCDLPFSCPSENPVSKFSRPGRGGVRYEAKSRKWFGVVEKHIPVVFILIRNKESNRSRLSQERSSNVFCRDPRKKCDGKFRAIVKWLRPSHERSRNSTRAPRRLLRADSPNPRERKLTETRARRERIWNESRAKANDQKKPLGPRCGLSKRALDDEDGDVSRAASAAVRVRRGRGAADLKGSSVSTHWRSKLFETAT